MKYSTKKIVNYVAEKSIDLMRLIGLIVAAMYITLIALPSAKWEWLLPIKNSKEPIDTVIFIAQLIVLFAGIFFTFRKIKEDNSVNYAKFFSDLNNDMVRNETYAKTFKRLDDYVSKRQEYEPFTTKDISAIAIYLNYFVVISVMLEKKVLRWEDVDDAYAWRFFAAMDNPDIQDLELSTYSNYNKQLFKLYYKWNTFRMERFCDEGGAFPLKEGRLLEKDYYKG